MNIVPLCLASSEALVRNWDSGGTIALQLLAILFLVLLNGFFVASEFAIVKVRGSQLEALEEEGEKRAAFARWKAAHPKGADREDQPLAAERQSRGRLLQQVGGFVISPGSPPGSRRRQRRAILAQLRRLGSFLKIM